MTNASPLTPLGLGLAWADRLLQETDPVIIEEYHSMLSALRGAAERAADLERQVYQMQQEALARENAAMKEALRVAWLALDRVCTEKSPAYANNFAAAALTEIRRLVGE